jgi:hypothetical protein
MIYIVGYKFTPNSTPKQEAKTTSISERIALAKRDIRNSKISSVFDARFTAGNVYEVARIHKVVENEESKIRYVFRNITKQEPDIDITFNNIGDGENYIAALSGNIQELNNIRNSITAAYETSSDI